MTMPAHTATDALPLLNSDYHFFLQQELCKARRQILVAMFLINVRLRSDPWRTVRGLILELENASWKGLDVRVMLGVSRNKSGRLASLTTAYYMQELGIPVRLFRPANTDGLHCKFVVIDGECVVIGSHNWTHTAFYFNREVSIALRSRAAVNQLAGDFEALWMQSDEPNTNRAKLVC